MNPHDIYTVQSALLVVICMHRMKASAHLARAAVASRVASHVAPPHVTALANDPPSFAWSKRPERLALQFLSLLRRMGNSHMCGCLWSAAAPYCWLFTRTVFLRAVRGASTQNSSFLARKFLARKRIGVAVAAVAAAADAAAAGRDQGSTTLTTISVVADARQRLLVQQGV